MAASIPMPAPGAQFGQSMPMTNIPLAGNIPPLAPQLPPGAVPMPLGAPNGSTPPPPMPMPAGFPAPNAPQAPPYIVDMQEDGSAIWRAVGPDGKPGPVVKVATGPAQGKANATSIIR